MEKDFSNSSNMLKIIAQLFYDSQHFLNLQFHFKQSGRTDGFNQQIHIGSIKSTYMKNKTIFQN